MSAIKDIVAFTEGRPDDAGAIEYAARLASAHGAHLTGAFLCPPLWTTSGAAYVRGEAIRQVLESYDGEMARLERTERQAFDGAARRHGLSAEWRAIRVPRIEDVIVNARYADLAVIARSAQGEHGGAPAGPAALATALAFGSGRPVILLPREVPRTVCRRILVGWNASREATRAVADALPLLVDAEAVALLVVDPEAHRAEHGQEPGADIARHLAHHGVRVDVRCAASRGAKVGALLLSEAAGFGADLLVMGAYGHSRLTELVFGGATQVALHEAALPVLMSR